MGNTKHSRPLFDAKGTAIALALIAAIISVHSAQYSASVLCNRFVKVGCEDSQTLLWPWQRDTEPAAQSNRSAEQTTSTSAAEVQKPCSVYRTSHGFNLLKENDTVTVHQDTDADGVITGDRIALVGGCPSQIGVSVGSSVITIGEGSQVLTNGLNIQFTTEDINGEELPVLLVTPSRGGIMSEAPVRVSIGATRLSLDYGDDVKRFVQAPPPVSPAPVPPQVPTVEPPATVTVDTGPAAVPGAEKQFVAIPVEDPNNPSVACKHKKKLPWLYTMDVCETPTLVVNPDQNAPIPSGMVKLEYTTTAIPTQSPSFENDVAPGMHFTTNGKTADEGTVTSPAPSPFLTAPVPAPGSRETSGSPTRQNADDGDEWTDWDTWNEETFTSPKPSPFITTPLPAPGSQGTSSSPPAGTTTSVVPGPVLPPVAPPPTIEPVVDTGGWWDWWPWPSPIVEPPVPPTLIVPPNPNEEFILHESADECEDVVRCPAHCGDGDDNDGVDGTDIRDPKCIPLNDPRCERVGCIIPRGQQDHCADGDNNDDWGGADLYDPKCFLEW